jgi:hypothetical protein
MIANGAHDGVAASKAAPVGIERGYREPDRRTLEPPGESHARTSKARQEGVRPGAEDSGGRGSFGARSRDADRRREDPRCARPADQAVDTCLRAPRQAPTKTSASWSSAGATRPCARCLGHRAGRQQTSGRGVRLGHSVGRALSRGAWRAVFFASTCAANFASASRQPSWSADSTALGSPRRRRQGYRKNAKRSFLASRRARRSQLQLAWAGRWAATSSRLL